MSMYILHLIGTMSLSSGIYILGWETKSILDDLDFFTLILLRPLSHKRTSFVNLTTD